MKLTKDYTHDVGDRYRYLILAVSIFFLLAVTRLFFLQVIRGNYYRLFSERNSVKEERISALRGMILDRNGVVLVDNQPTFDIVAVPQHVLDKDKMADTVSRLINIPKDVILSTLKKAKKTAAAYRPVVIKSDATMDDISMIMARKLPWTEDGDEYDLRGVDVRLRYIRLYPDGSIAPHVLGYLKEIDEKRLKDYQERYPDRYVSGDLVGIGGVEEEWERSLKGVDGYAQKIVNAVGREIDYGDLTIGLQKRPPSHGYNLRLTLDSELQNIAREQMKDRSGAVVALDPKTGAVLALYSSPGYDLNLLKDPLLGKDYWREISTADRKYLYNRAVQGTYPPGSVYKIVTALAALENGLVTPEEKISCAGGMNFGGRFFRCWSSGHGATDMIRAISESCDVYFYTLGLRLGVDKLHEYAVKLGYGKKTGVDLPYEKPGLIPTSEWKMKRFNRPWNRGEELSISIGQGYDSVTPLQAAMMTAMTANGGYAIKPHLVDAVVDEEGKELFKFHDTPQSLGISSQSIDIVKKGMVAVVEGPAGTAGRMRALNLKIAGKTGTSQVVGVESGITNIKTHAWFSGYAPHDDPQIAVAVIVEHGGHGGADAAPVAGEIIKKYLSEKKDQ